MISKYDKQGNCIYQETTAEDLKVEKIAYGLFAFSVCFIALIICATIIYYK